jgi:hypothetical protein
MLKRKYIVIYTCTFVYFLNKSKKIKKNPFFSMNETKMQVLSTRKKSSFDDYGLFIYLVFFSTHLYL